MSIKFETRYLLNSCSNHINTKIFYLHPNKCWRLHLVYVEIDEFNQVKRSVGFLFWNFCIPPFCIQRILNTGMFYFTKWIKDVFWHLEYERISQLGKLDCFLTKSQKLQFFAWKQKFFLFWYIFRQKKLDMTGWKMGTITTSGHRPILLHIHTHKHTHKHTHTNTHTQTHTPIYTHNTHAHKHTHTHTTIHTKHTHTNTRMYRFSNIHTLIHLDFFRTLF